MTDTHSLERTSPKGGPFIGTCTKCGATNLSITATRQECVNPAGLSQDDALMIAVEGREGGGPTYDMSIHTNPDAAAWAKLFRETFPDTPHDEGLMCGWFANAMMAMHDHLTGQAPTVLPDGSAFFVAQIGEQP